MYLIQFPVKSVARIRLAGTFNTFKSNMRKASHDLGNIF